MAQILSTVLVALVLLGPVSGYSAIEPYFVRTNEFSAILTSKPIKQLIQRTRGSSKLIDSIHVPAHVSASGRYEVGSGNCTLQVHITYVVPPQPGFVGPGQLMLTSDPQMACD